MLKRSLLCTASARAIRALEVYERTIVRLAIVAFGTTVLLSWPAYPAPQGGDVVGGSATIGRSGAATTVDQASEKAIINWQAFSIASGETVNFNQPGPSSIALNRVVGGNLSEIYGALRSNGRLILVNPKGIVFGEGARVDVGGLVATTSDISDEGFMAGRLVFDRPGDAGASVINKGSITAADAGIVAFVAPHARNSGVIKANLGTVELAAGTKFTLDLYGDDLISFSIDAQVLQVAKDKNGEPVAALVEVGGDIHAEGGKILITADAARGLIDNAIIANGNLIARSVSQEGGTIVLNGGDSGAVLADGNFDASGKEGGSFVLRNDGRASIGGKVDVSGQSGGSVSVRSGGQSIAGSINASGASGSGGTVDIHSTGDALAFSSANIDVSGSSGGTIRQTAEREIISSATYNLQGKSEAGGKLDMSAPVTKLLSAKIDASGETDGGVVRIGGEYQGGKALTIDELPNASTTVVSSGTLISADALGLSGRGGTVVLWSENDTVFLGSISAKPGAAAGEGGSVEVSSANALQFDGTIEASAEGRPGTVLLDPKNLTVVPDSFDRLKLILGFNYAGNPAGLNSGTTTLGTTDLFGAAVSLDGTRLAVGAPQNDGAGGGSTTDSGAVYLFSFADTSFNSPVLEAVIGEGYTGGKNFNQSLDDDQFGSAVALDGNRLAVGAPLDNGFNNGQSSNGGAVYLFSFADSVFTTPTLQAIIGEGYTGGKNFNQSLNSDDDFGAAVSLDGNRLAVGAPQDDGLNNTGTTNSGAVYLFSFADSLFTTPTLQGTIGENYTGGKNFNLSLDADLFGSSVSLDGNRLAVGAINDDGSGVGDNANNIGNVRLFTYTDSVFSGGALAATIGEGYTGGNNLNLATQLDNGDFFGSGVSLSGTSLAVGARQDDGSGVGSNSNDNGAVYIVNFTNTTFSGPSLSLTIGEGYTGGSNYNLSAQLDTGDLFGSAVSLEGTRLAAGARQDDGSGVGSNANNIGAAYLFDLAAPISVAGATFANLPTSDSVITVGTLTTLLNAGTAVTLQANNDFTLATNLTVNNPGGNGGALTIQAGRSALLNGNIVTDNGNLTIVANETLANGVVDANRDAGGAVLTMAAGTSINAGTGNVRLTLANGAGKTNSTAGDVSLRTISAGTVIVENLGVGNHDVILNGTITAGTGATPIVVASLNGDFTNNAGASALSPGAGRFLVYAQSPAGNVAGGLTANPYYNKVYNPASPTGVTATGNRFVYTLAPNLTVTANNANRAYGDPNPAFSATITGYLVGDNPALAVSGSPAFSTPATQSSNVGPYAITPSIGTLVSDFNYGFTFANGTLTINPATLLVTANDDAREYGEANPSFSATITGFKLGQSAGTALSGAPAFSTPAVAASNVGPYAITPSLGTLAANNGNYVFTFADGTLTVTPATLLVTANDDAREYGEANPSFSATITGFKLGQSAGTALSGAPTFSTPAVAASNVGPYAITPSLGSLAANNGNYVFTFADGTLTVDPATLLVTANDASRDYGDANPAFSATITGFKLLDTEGSALTGAAGLSTSATASSNVGPYAINASLGTLAANNGNYVFTFADGTLTVDPATLLVTTNDASRDYGDANPAFSATITGFKLLDTEGSALTGAAGLSTSATASSNVGPYAINASLGTLAANNGNYVFTFADGTLTVDSAPLTVTANDATRQEGQPNPIFTAAIIGLKLGDGPGVVSGLTFSTPATAGSPPGSYPIASSGGTATNYAVVARNDGTLTVTPAGSLLPPPSGGSQSPPSTPSSGSGNALGDFAEETDAGAGDAPTSGGAEFLLDQSQTSGFTLATLSGATGAVGPTPLDADTERLIILCAEGIRESCDQLTQ